MQEDFRPNFEDYIKNRCKLLGKKKKALRKLTILNQNNM